MKHLPLLLTLLLPSCDDADARRPGGGVPPWIACPPEYHDNQPPTNPRP